VSRANPRFRRVNASLPQTIGQAVVQYRLLGLQENQVTICTFNYQGPNPSPTATQLASLLTSISGNLLSPFLACVSSDWTVDFEELNVVTTNAINGVFSTTHSGTAGSRGTPALNTEMAIVINRECVVKGQHGRGRVSLPGVAAADVTRSRITAAALTTAVNALQAAMLLTASDGVNVYTPVMAQRATTTPRLVIGASPLTSVTHGSLLGTVRRRKIGRGK
jgi:hypothetical protein